MARYLVKLPLLGKSWFLVTWCSWQKTGLPCNVCSFVGSCWWPSQVWGVFRGAAVLPGRQGLCVGPCSAFQRCSCPSSLPLYFLVGHAMITSILAKCRFMDCAISTLHQWLSVNVDLFKEVYPYTHMSLVCWSYDWVCDGTGNTPIARFISDHHILYMSH